MTRIKRPKPEDTLVTVKDLYAFRERYIRPLEEAEARRALPWWRRVWLRMQEARG